MARIYTEEDAAPEALRDRTVVVLGYGNQGRSQALNLRDSGVRVVVGNRDDAFRDRAVADEMDPLPISEATALGDVVLVLLPDEVHAEVLGAEVLPYLRPGAAVVFAHGYSVHFGEVDVPEGHDVMLLAPKMLGPAVRDLYLQGTGFPSLVAVHRDTSGQAWQVLLALAGAIGSLTAGAWETTFEEEAITDLFGEQVGGSGAIVGLLRSFEALVAAGYDPDVVQLELLGSGELVEVIRAQVRLGLLPSLSSHSPTSHFGQLYRAAELWDGGQDDRLSRILEQLKDGSFAEVWRAERRDGYRMMRDLEERFGEHPYVEAERRNRERLKDVLDAELGTT